MTRVLIMEDNLNLALEWRDAFEVDGFEVVMCANGEDAVRQVKWQKIDLIISDLFVKSAAGGIHLLVHIRAMGTLAPPVIVVTATKTAASLESGSNFFLEQAEALGAAVCVQKPIQPAELVQIAHSLLDGSLT